MPGTSIVAGTSGSLTNAFLVLKQLVDSQISVFQSPSSRIRQSDIIWKMSIWLSSEQKVLLRMVELSTRYEHHCVTLFLLKY